MASMYGCSWKNEAAQSRPRVRTELENVSIVIMRESVLKFVAGSFLIKGGKKSTLDLQ